MSVTLFGFTPRIGRFTLGDDKRLMHCFVGPLNALKYVGSLAYDIDIPAFMNCLDITHVLLLKIYNSRSPPLARKEMFNPLIPLTPCFPGLSIMILLMSLSRPAAGTFLVAWKDDFVSEFE